MSHPQAAVVMVNLARLLLRCEWPLDTCLSQCPEVSLGVRPLSEGPQGQNERRNQT